MEIIEKITESIRDNTESFGRVNEKDLVNNLSIIYEKYKILFAETKLNEIKKHSIELGLNNITNVTNDIISEMVNNSEVTAEQFNNESI